MNNRQFFDKTAYDYRIHTLETELAAFRSGQKYVQMEMQYHREIRYLEGIIRKLRAELADAHRETVTVRKNWSEVIDDLDAEHRAEIAKKDRQIERLRERVLEAERQRNAAKDKTLEKQKELYAVQTEREEVKGLNRKLTAQVNKDFENSSVPSSLQGPGKKKIPNSREKTDRKPGGQPGHKGAGRKKQEPTLTVVLPPPEEVQDHPDYYKTGKTKSKQMISIHLSVETVNYVAEEYRNRKTGTRIYAGFPEGVVDDVNYDGTVRAFLCLLHTECNVSIDHARQFLKELTGGKLDISKGMVSRLGEEFSKKTEAERQEMINRLMSSPVMHADFTNANVNGNSRQVLILSTPSGDAALYFAREKKGHAGVKGTPLENDTGIVVSDHDTTFYSYGLKHMEHKRNPEKDYWTEAIVFTTSNNSFGPTEISYLENRFCNLAVAANRYDVKNGNDPTPGNITEEKESEMEEFIDYAKVIMGTLGHKLFEPIKKPQIKRTEDVAIVSDESAKLHLERTIKNVGKVKASGTQTAEGYAFYQPFLRCDVRHWKECQGSDKLENRKRTVIEIA